jgi:hypothetical protein
MLHTPPWGQPWCSAPVDLEGTRELLAVNDNGISTVHGGIDQSHADRTQVRRVVKHMSSDDSPNPYPDTSARPKMPSRELSAVHKRHPVPLKTTATVSVRLAHAQMPCASRPLPSVKMLEKRH